MGRGLACLFGCLLGLLLGFFSLFLFLFGLGLPVAQTFGPLNISRR